MRKSLLVGAALASSIALAACTSTVQSTKASVKEMVASFGSQPYTQVSFTAGFTGAGASSTEQSVLNDLSLSLHLQSASGAALSQSQGNVNVELLANVGTKTFLDIRQVGANVYVLLNATALSGAPGLKVSSAELAGFQLFFGGRWFELPKSLLDEISPRTAAGATPGIGAADHAAEARIIDAITRLISTSSHTSLANGVLESGTLANLQRAFEPTIAGIANRVLRPTASPGTYKLVLTTSGSSVTGLSVSVTAPNGTKGNATGTVTAKVSHDSDSVTVPTGATVVSKQLISELESMAASR